MFSFELTSIKSSPEILLVELKRLLISEIADYKPLQTTIPRPRFEFYPGLTIQYPSCSISLGNKSKIFLNYIV